MSGNHYRRGRDFEYAVRAHLAGEGYWVARSAGSKTKVDLIAVKAGEILLVQCKLANADLPNSEWNELLRIAGMIREAKAVVAVKIPGQVIPEFRQILASTAHREHRVAGRHWAPWSPDALGDAA